MTKIPNIPKGTLLIIGGAEDKGEKGQLDISEKNKDFKHLEILSELIPAKKNGRAVEIITTATSQPEEVYKMYKNAFAKIGFRKTGFINMGDNYDAANPLFLERIGKAHAVLFSGGDQFRLSTILGNTDVLDRIIQRYADDPDFIVAGTSAGAMAAATLMMYEGESNEALLKGTVKLSSGLGLIDGCIIDTHFVKRGRFGRLAQAIVMNPTCIGIGLGEDTALIIKKGNEAECRGSGMVTIIDGKPIGHTNIAFAENHSPLYIENLRVHILCNGNGFLLDERKFLETPKRIEKETKENLKLIEAELNLRPRRSTRKK